MLPQGIYPISKIEQEYAADTQVTKLVSLLGYLLSLINPNVTPKDGKNVGFGERVNANNHLFTNVPDIFFAIGVRNSIIHPENCENAPTEAEIKRAAKHLRNAIYEMGCGLGFRGHRVHPQLMEITSIMWKVLRRGQCPPCGDEAPAASTVSRTSTLPARSNSNVIGTVDPRAKGSFGCISMR